MDWSRQAERIPLQKPKDKGKRYTAHAPEPGGLDNGQARKSHGFGLKVST
ncbi:hypothetical protein [Ralstonia solanacearum]|nr:hypothetical protein [Ralstonia solanacearum]MCL9845505.1 hypothetical protein [Ralstonia solanacearum]MDC6255238.1 hypothetical protein [Ralstonia solanacearum]MDC6259553.1 hypothetical protein [Ralstonia solanacearum]MDC6303758.1 hypothetical protein [Ralstonia solanacearum]